MPNPDPLATTAKTVLSDQHKLPVRAFDAAMEELAASVFTRARELGVRVKFSITHPGTILNDGTGVPYLDLSEKSNNQGTFTYLWSMDPSEPVQWPDPTPP